MSTELKHLIEQVDALLARFCEAIDRAERIAQEADQPDPFAGHPELPLATSNQHPIPGINCDINGKPIQP
jgi:hypothetical protein